MGDTYILDTNVMPDIARGNERAAEALKQRLQTGQSVTISQAAYNELTEMPNNKALGAQYREMLNDLKIRPAPPGSMADRVRVYAENIQVTPGPGKPGPLDEYGRGANRGKPGDAFVAAQAASTEYKLWTFDEKVQKRAPQFGIQLAPECTIKGVSGVEDPARARRLLGLPPIEINAQGVVTRRHPFGSPYGFTGTVKVPSAPPVEINPSQRGQAIVGGIGLVFEGVNIILHLINNEMQKNAVEAALANQRDAIVRARVRKPNMGILIIIYYTQVVPRDITLITPGRRFSHLIWGQGRTIDEARQDAYKAPMLMPGVGVQELGSPMPEKEVVDNAWLPALEPDSVTNVKTPFPVLAVGCFQMTNERKVEIQNVTFGMFEGFDDNWQTTRELAASLNPEFAILDAPAEVRWLNRNGSHPVKIPLKSARTANGHEITVVDLDPWAFGSATAVPVFPMNEVAKKVFNTTSPTEHRGLLNHYVNFAMLRWIRPGNIQLLRFVERKK